MRPSSRHHIVLIGLIMLGACLRFMGLRWSLPNVDHVFSYHPDELIAPRAAMRLMFSRGDIDPGYFFYGHHYFYLIHCFGALCRALGFMGNEYASWLLLSRGLSAIFSTLTLPLVYQMVRQVWGVRAALLGVALVAVSPLLVYHAHFATVDSYLGFWCLLALAAISTSVKRREARWYLLAGTAAAAAFTVKYSAIVLLPLALMSAVIPKKRAWAAMFQAGGLITLGYGLGLLLTMPVLFLRFKEFWRVFAYQMTEFPRGENVLYFEQTGNGFAYLLGQNLPAALDGVLVLLSVLALGWASFRLYRSRSKSNPLEWILLLWLALGFVILSSAQLRYARYLVPWIVPLLIVTVGFVDALLKKSPRVIGLLITLVAFDLLWCSLAYARLFKTPDARDQALYWIRQHIPEGSTIAYVKPPWFYSPPISPFNGGYRTQDLFEQWAEHAPYRMQPVGADAESLTSKRADFVVFADEEIRDELRLRHEPALKFEQALRENYIPAVAPFQTQPKIFGRNFMRETAAPDWRYVPAMVHVFRRR